MLEEFYHLAKKYCRFIDLNPISHDTILELTLLLLQSYYKSLSLTYNDSFEELNSYSY